MASLRVIGTRAAVLPCRTASRAVPIPSHSRSYHSYEHEEPPPFSNAENAILSAALSHVPTHGFSTTALSHGAREVGYLEVSTNLFPRGPFDLINYHLVSQRLALKDHVQFPSGKLGVGAKVKLLALHRLQANKSIIHQWQEVICNFRYLNLPSDAFHLCHSSILILFLASQSPRSRRYNADQFPSMQALAAMAVPAYVVPSFRELARLSDEIWFLAGDTSVDTSWYSKRATLSAIYSATEIFMTTDFSVNFKETEQFLDRRLEEARLLGGAVGNVGQWVGFTGVGILNLLRSKGTRI